LWISQPRRQTTCHCDLWATALRKDFGRPQKVARFAIAIRQTAHLTTFTIATNEYRGGNNERTEYHPCVAWDRLTEITGQFLSKLVDVEGRLQTRQWDDDAGKGRCAPSSLQPDTGLSANR
jgi:Single-strand binding protein family